MNGTSWDFVEDAVESLEKDDCHYVLCIGKPGFNTTHVFMNCNESGAESFLYALKLQFAKKFPDNPKFKQ